MQSDGGLTPTSKFIGSRAILSGPAGGVVSICLHVLLIVSYELVHVY